MRQTSLGFHDLERHPLGQRDSQRGPDPREGVSVTEPTTARAPAVRGEPCALRRRGPSLRLGREPDTKIVVDAGRSPMRGCRWEEPGVGATGRGAAGCQAIGVAVPVVSSSSSVTTGRVSSSATCSGQRSRTVSRPARLDHGPGAVGQTSSAYGAGQRPAVTQRSGPREHPTSEAEGRAGRARHRGPIARPRMTLTYRTSSGVRSLVVSRSKARSAGRPPPTASGAAAGRPCRRADAPEPRRPRRRGRRG